MINPEFFKKVYLFESLDANELKWLCETVKEKDFIAGDAIFSEGSVASALYIIRSGSVNILKKGTEDDQQITTLGVGSLIGEMAFLDGTPRYATAEAKENVQLVELPFFVLEQKLNQDPKFAMKFYKSMTVFLNKRIKQTTGDFSHLIELKLRHV